MSKNLAPLGIALAAILVLTVSVSTTAQQAATPLKDVGDLLVGDWTGEGIWAADYPGFGKKGDRFTSTHTCRWAVGAAVLECEGSAGGPTWKSIHWWDAASEQVKMAGVNSGGNWDQGTIAKQGAKLVWETSGSFSDGQAVQYKGETLFEDNGDTQIVVGATILDGVPSEFRDVYKRVRD
jgi:hypothetical protein